VHDDLVARQFTADGPDRTWLTDITEHPTAEGKLYLCAIKDVYSNRIVGYSMDARMTAGLAVSALRNAIALRCPAGTVVVHSDRGSQFPVRFLRPDTARARPDRLDGPRRRLRR
jgi:transposase InsO family protein